MSKEPRPDQEVQEQWWQRPARRMPRAAVYAVVLMFVVVSQWGALKIAAAMLPDRWDYKVRAWSDLTDRSRTDPTFTIAQLSEEILTDPTVSDPTASTGPNPTFSTNPLPTSTPKPPTGTPFPSPTPTGTMGPFTFRMEADKTEVRPGEKVTYTIRILSAQAIDLTITSHVPNGTTTENPNCQLGKSDPLQGSPTPVEHECKWTVGLRPNAEAAVQFTVSVTNAAPSVISNHAHASDGNFSVTSNVVNVRVKSSEPSSLQ